MAQNSLKINNEFFHRTAEEKFVIRVYGKSELARMYGISLKTLGKWIARLRPHCPGVFPDKEAYKRTRLLTPAQVRAIVEHVGEPC
ncbi:MAG: hypothetical protein KatS3mg031_1250 [Chitinophagales bacterium]|nr:MAG: hypothetical protein KatS3mg031_1250 [Chitinophagales bacterium]